MTLLQLAIFLAVALTAALIRRGRDWLLLAASILIVFWLQPTLPIRQLDFWIPLATLALVAITWTVTQPSPLPQHRRENWTAAGLITLLPILLGITRFFDLSAFLPSLPPDPIQILIVILLMALLAVGVSRLVRHSGSSPSWLAVTCIFCLIGLFVILKNDALATTIAAALRSFTGQSTALASPLDIRWLGFSYLAFRLIHVLRDRMNGRLPYCTLKEFIIYALFFPAFLSGPIDRLERFQEDLRRPFLLSSANLMEGGRRIVWGAFKKFAIADFLALMALNTVNAAQITGAGWMWITLYAYAFRLYFDFSGYTDIAIGLGRWMGFALPENFDRPYTQPHLTAFWNSWHITLAQWFRSYFFNPVTRLLRSKIRNLPVPVIVLTGQLSTMALIGLWHGITWNYLAWGLWHGGGLFLHSRWTEYTRRREANRPDGMSPSPAGDRFQRVRHGWRRAGGVLLTFHFVALGWVWFALPSVDASLRVFACLFGIPWGGGY
jgi:alginate O-acetyltransferase complex protein AlgI